MYVGYDIHWDTAFTLTQDRIPVTPDVLSELLQAPYPLYVSQTDSLSLIHALPWSKRIPELLQASCTLYVSQTDTPNFCKAYTRFGVVETDFPNFYKASTRFTHICVHLGML